MSKPHCFKTSYAEKLKDPRWQKKRLEIIERDNGYCRDCGLNDEPLQVHHLFYLKGREPWEYEEHYLLSLCEGCHVNRQLIEDEAKELIALMFGQMNVWRIYEIGKEVKRLIQEEQRPIDCTVTLLSELKEGEF